jgi:hypothetical protein
MLVERNCEGRLAGHLQKLSRTETAAVSDRAGVPPRIGARARAGRKVTATSYLLLCLAAGIDAATGAPFPTVPRAGCAIVWWLFGSSLFLSRRGRRLDLRSAAVLVGVSAATLSRAECGKPISVESFLCVARFIGVPPESFLCFTGNTNCNTLKQNESAEVPLDCFTSGSLR